MGRKLITSIVTGAAAIGILVSTIPNAQAATKSSGYVKLTKWAPNCQAKITVDDNVKNKVRGTVYLKCTGQAILTPYVAFYRGKDYILPKNVSPGPRIVGTKEFKYSTTTDDKPGTQCYKGNLTIVFPQHRNQVSFIKTGCLNT
ncbi:hypothetical protein HZZ00_06465 [Streptomyces sp. NEAU-sy36]|uniref:hypothetical protein n=1 Tax=unclassified Streptomyces TaxID=2593676 RepID=UPI0015D5D099|nr:MULTISPECIES: hypothetical protein [unclassified Streptomyces]QLJ00666.1 hypothetical protein HZZ00_06465 [Streptomyces sp. NEAU-sy36]